MGPLEWLFVTHHIRGLYSQAEDVADRQQASDAIRRRALENRLEAEREQRRAAENTAQEAPKDLATEVAWLRVLTRALAELCLEKGVVTEEELRERVRKLDEEHNRPA